MSKDKEMAGNSTLKTHWLRNGRRGPKVLGGVVRNLPFISFHSQRHLIFLDSSS